MQAKSNGQMGIQSKAARSQGEDASCLGTESPSAVSWVSPRV